MHAHFSEWGTPVPHGKLPPFRFWCQKTLPTLYDDSLSYYEVLSNVTWYINQIINVCKVYDDKFCELMGVYKQLEHYVNCYFDNLNVPQTIADILDDMAFNGTLSDVLVEYMKDFSIDTRKLKGGIVVIHYEYDSISNGVEKYNRVESDKDVVDILRHGSVIMGAFNGSPKYGNYFAMMDSATYTYEETEHQCAGGCACRYITYDSDFTILYDEVTIEQSTTWTLDNEPAVFVKRRLGNDTKEQQTTVEYLPLCADVADHYVTHVKMANDAIWSENIKDGEVKTPDLADGAVTTAKLADNSVTSAKIVDGTIQTVDLADGSVTTAKLADNSVTSAKIVDGTVATADLANSAVTTAKLADNSVTSAKIVDGTIQTVDLADGSVTEPKLADNAVTSAKIKDGEVKTADLADGAVTTAKLADDAVTSAKIKDGEVKTNDLADGAVTTNKLANDSVTSAKIVDGGVATADLANGAVTTAKLADGAVTNPKYADASITLEKIAEPYYIFLGDVYDGVNGGWTDKAISYLGVSSGKAKKLSSNDVGFVGNGSTFLSNLQTVAGQMTAKQKLETGHIIVVGGNDDRGKNDGDIINAMNTFASYVDSNFPNAKVHVGQVSWRLNKVAGGSKWGYPKVTKEYIRGCGFNGFSYMDNSEYALHEYRLFDSTGWKPNADGCTEIALCVAISVNGGQYNKIVDNNDTPYTINSALNIGKDAQNNLFPEDVPETHTVGFGVTMDNETVNINFTYFHTIEFLNATDLIGHFPDGNSQTGEFTIITFEPEDCCFEYQYQTEFTTYPCSVRDSSGNVTNANIMLKFGKDGNGNNILAGALYKVKEKSVASNVGIEFEIFNDVKFIHWGSTGYTPATFNSRFC